MSLFLLFIFIILGVQITPILIKKYPCILPEVIWKEWYLTHLKRKEIYIILVLFFGILGLNQFSLLFLDPTTLSSAYLFFMATLIFLGYMDFKTRLIPDFITLPLTLWGILLPFVSAASLMTPFEAILGACVGYGLPAIIGFLFYPWRSNGLGAGDVKLLMMVGAWLGMNGLSFVLIGSLILFAGYAAYKKQKLLPLAPFIGISSLILMTLHPIFFN